MLGAFPSLPGPLWALTMVISLFCFCIMDAKNKTSLLSPISPALVMVVGVKSRNPTIVVIGADRTNTDRPERAVGNLAADAFLELECKLDCRRPKPLPVGDFPLELCSQQMLILDLHELTIEVA